MIEITGTAVRYNVPFRSGGRWLMYAPGSIRIRPDLPFHLDHDDVEVGHVVDSRDSAQGLRIQVYADDAHRSALWARAALSVTDGADGFEAEEVTMRGPSGLTPVTVIQRSHLTEISAVRAGAVPGTWIDSMTAGLRAYVPPVRRALAHAGRRAGATIEVRTFRNGEVRASTNKGPNGRPTVTLRAITPGVVDDFGSCWLATTFDKAMQRRLAADPHDTPALCWAHQWADPIGHGISYTPTSSGPLVEFEFDDFVAVPRARQAHAQVQSKTIRDCSVGFFDAKRREPTKEERARMPGVLEVIEEADLDEVSLVLRGAVPGAKVAV